MNPAIIPAAASFIGGAIGNMQNRSMSREQMAFQERMSNTQYQRAVADMRMAGINPMLAYMQGGAGTPSGSTATMNDVVSPAVSSAMHASRLKSELTSMMYQRDNLEQDTSLKTAQRDLAEEQARRTRAEEEHIRLQNVGQVAQNRLLGLQIPRRKLESDVIEHGRGQFDRIREGIYGPGGAEDWARNKQRQTAMLRPSWLRTPEENRLIREYRSRQRR